jgi:hypothetical protein
VSSLRDRPADEPLFGSWAQDVAEDQGREAAFRWLTLSDEPEAAGLRAALERGFAQAGHSADVLAKGLAHERWGQHAGARAHLLTLALLAHLDLQITSEPELGPKSPDILAARDGAQALLEVRSLTGCGEEPWTRTPGVTRPRRQAPRSGRRSSREKDQRRRAREAAVERAAAAAVNARDLRRSVADAVTTKVDAYAQLVTLPFVVVLYEDTDHQLAELVGDWGPGDGKEPGAWERAVGRFAPLSAVLVLGRELDEDGACLLRAEGVVNGGAKRPLPADLVPLHLAPTRLVAPGP